MKKPEIKKDFDSQVLDISRVERMTSGGRRLRFRTLVVIGNKKGKVGVGTAKGLDVQQAIEKATKTAQKSAVFVPIAKGGTIPHEVKAKFGAAVILLKPQGEGRGLVAGGTVRIICAMAGIENISGKILGNTRNKLNNAKATIKALQKLKVLDGGKDEKLEEKEISELLGEEKETAKINKEEAEVKKIKPKILVKKEAINKEAKKTQK
jgi:small subunit ribosomal protein S5